MSQLYSLKVRVPDLPTAYKASGIDYSKQSTIDANIKMIQSINTTYGSICNKWGIVFNIPKEVIIAFIATESGGRMLAPNKYKATGLMQVTPDAIWESVRKWDSIVKSPLPTEAKSELQRKIPQIFTSKAIQPDAITNNTILSNLQKDANFNILCGTLVLRWLINRFSTSLTGGQLNKAMVAYNAGAYIKPLNISSSSPIVQPIDTIKLATNRLVPLESRSYLYKMLGKDGFLALILQRNAI